MKLDKRHILILLSSVLILSLIIFLAVFKPPKGTDTAQKKPDLSKFRTLPYLAGKHKSPKKDKITKFQPDLVSAGLNLYNSAHWPTAIIMDMTGKTLHRWRLRFKDAFPDFKDIDVWHKQRHWRLYWRKVHVFNNGDLLAIYEGNGLIKIDSDSNLIWATKGGFHHDFEVMDNRIYALNRRLITLPRIHEKEPILEDLITILDADGQVLDNISILELFENSEYMSLLEGMPPFGDIFHTNTIEVFDGGLAAQSPLFKEGNVLLSFRMTDTIAIADLEEQKIVWAQKPGFWKVQHQPTLLDNGNILLFNNLYLGERADKAEYERLIRTNGYRLIDEKLYTDDRSSVIEFNPQTMEIVWEYKGDADNPFFSLASGAIQRLPNGNTLITESDRGRVFEVTPEGQIVWEYINPHRAGEEKDKIAVIFELIRFQPAADFFIKRNK